jgi:hypothetical protein
MLYNDLVGYSQSGVSYQGTLTLSVPGFSINLLPPSIAVYIGDELDFNNLSTIGIATVSSVKTGSITLEVTEQQAYSMAQSSTVYIVKSGSISNEITTLEEGSTIRIAIVSTTATAEQALA